MAQKDARMMGWRLGTTFKRKTGSTGAGCGTGAWVDALNVRLHRGGIARWTKTLRSYLARMKKLSHEDDLRKNSRIWL